jgi:hypothetical protein
MSLRLGAYFASHSGMPVLALGQRGAALFCWYGRPIVQNDGDGFARHSRLGAMDVIEPSKTGEDTDFVILMSGEPKRSHQDATP